ncbi:MAG: nuclear transport factor 2 family protein [Sinimarinibacterium sp.]|jgi:ketosteroid isomerase-like protein
MRRAILCVALGLAGCAHAPVDRAAEAEMLLDADRAFAALSASTDTGRAFAAYMAADGMQLPAQGEPVLGVDAVVARIAAGPPSRLLWTPRYAEVAAAADMGWTWGDWQAFDPAAPEQPLAGGRYVNVWLRQPDGSWKVRLDMGNVARSGP